jgi:hypothetical protein
MSIEIMNNTYYISDAYGYVIGIEFPFEIPGYGTIRQYKDWISFINWMNNMYSADCECNGINRENCPVCMKAAVASLKDDEIPY